MKVTKYITNYFNKLNGRYFFIKTVILKNLLAALKGNKYPILADLLNITVFIKTVSFKDINLLYLGK